MVAHRNVGNALGLTDQKFGAKLDGYIARKGEFRNRILDAAEELILETGDLSFSTRDLATRAAVSAATPFNHFRSKQGVLNGIVERSLDRLSRRAESALKSADPLERIFEQADTVLSYYSQKPKLYRPVFGGLFGSEATSPHKLLLQANAFWRSGLRAALDAGQLQEGRDLEVISGQLEINWIGSLMLWIGKTLDGPGWKIRAAYGTALALISIVAEIARPSLEKKVFDLETKLAGIIPRMP